VPSLRYRAPRAYQLTASNFGALPVVKPRGILAGLVSEFDLLRVLMEGRELDSVRAEEIMTREITTVKESTPVDDVIRLMEKKHLIRVPVVAEGKLVGMLARRDILYGALKRPCRSGLLRNKGRALGCGVAGGDGDLL
jgi:CBS domain-containing protein